MAIRSRNDSRGTSKMGKLQALYTISNLESLKDITRYVTASFDQIQTLINGKNGFVCVF